MKSRSWYFVSFALICVCIFSVLLFFNFRTTLLVDDYAYFFDFATSDSISDYSESNSSLNLVRIQSLQEIFSSMAAHRYTMNGRVIPHGIVQFFLWLSPNLFKVVNSAVFLLQILAIFFSIRFVIHSEKPEYLFKALLLCAIFASIYVFTPSFGQVNLWLDGAVNYLWGSTVSILYMVFILKTFVFGTHSKKIGIIQLTALILFGFTVGSWAENSGGAIIVFMLCIIFAKLLFKERISPAFIFCMLSVIAGFLFMVAAPAELRNKVGDDFSMMRVFRGFFDVAIFMLRNFLPICAVTAVLFILCFFIHVDNKQLIYVGILILTALAAAFSLAIGSYIAERSFFFTVPVLVMADAWMFTMLINRKRKLILCIVVVLLLFTPKELLAGASDISDTYWSLKANENYIIESVQNGVYDVSIPMVSCNTKYSALYRQMYLNVDTPYTWPNCYMAKYYGADLIRGVDK